MPKLNIHEGGEAGKGKSLLMDYDQKNQFRMSGEYNDSHTNTILVALGDKNERKMVDGVYCGA